MNTRMFVSIIGIDPVIVPKNHKKHIDLAVSGDLAVLTLKRTDKWPSLEAAHAWMKSSSMFKMFDPRVTKKYSQHAFRTMPNARYPNETGVSLATPSTQELITFIPLPIDLKPDQEPYTQFASFQCGNVLDNIKIPKLMIQGTIGRSLNDDFKRVHGQDKTMHFAHTDGTHMVPFEEPTLVAELSAKFISETYATWRKEQADDIKTPRTYEFHPLYLKHYGPLVQKMVNSRKANSKL